MKELTLQDSLSLDLDVDGPITYKIEIALVAKALGKTIVEVEDMSLAELGNNIMRVINSIIKPVNYTEDGRKKILTLNSPVGDKDTITLDDISWKDVKERTGNKQLVELVDILSSVTMENTKTIEQLSLADTLNIMRLYFPKVMYPPILSLTEDIVQSYLLTS